MTGTLRTVSRGALGFLVVGMLYLALLAFPQPLFAYQARHASYDIWSDRPIGPGILAVLEDATRRLRTSDLYRPGDRFRIFICNDPWRLALLSQRFSSGMGGVADDWLARNIYIRESDIANNRLIPPSGELSDADVRPLSYFIAHEATHIQASRIFGRLVAIETPTWVMEGYADYVAKAGEFDFDENRRLFAAGDPKLDPSASGLYRRHHLLVAYTLEKKKYPVGRLFTEPPNEQTLVAELKRAR